MAVRIWFRDSFEPETVAGDLVTLMNNLNVAAANGKQFAILNDTGGEGLMVETRNIIKARESKDEDAFVGG
jgi:hypothetical protein